MVAAAIGLILAVADTAVAQTTAVTIDSRSVPLEAREGGGWKTSLGFTNLTEEQLSISAKATKPASGNCRLAFDGTLLPSAEHSVVGVVVPTSCTSAGKPVELGVLVRGKSTLPITFAVSATPAPDPGKSEWSALWAFPIALVVLLLAAIPCFFLWRKDDSGPNEPLKYLSATWNFTDSWATNVTVAGGLLTGLFGSTDVVTGFLGTEAKSSVALAVVGAALALVFTGAGPIVMASTRSKQGKFFTVGGLLFAAAVTLAGASGELWVVWRSGAKLDLGGWQNHIWILAVLAGILLLVYAYRSLPATIETGLEAPPEPPPSDAIVGASMIVAALSSTDQEVTTLRQNALRRGCYFPTGRRGNEQELLGRPHSRSHSPKKRIALISYKPAGDLPDIEDGGKDFEVWEPRPGGVVADYVEAAAGSAYGDVQEVRLGGCLRAVELLGMQLILSQVPERDVLSGEMLPSFISA